MNIGNLFPSRFLKVSDLDGKTLTLTIKSVAVEQIGDEQKPMVSFTNHAKALVLNKTNARTIAKVAGSADTSGWMGKQITLVPSVMDFRGDQVECIRVSPKTKAAPQPSAEVEPEDDSLEF